VVVAVRSEILRHGLHSMLRTIPAVGDAAVCADSAALRALAGTGPVDTVIISPPVRTRELQELRDRQAGHPPKVLLVLRDSGDDAVRQAAEVSPDGILLESDLTAAALADTLLRMCQDQLPVPSRLTRELLSRLRVRQSTWTDRPFLLTPRELQTLPLLAQGLSNRQIARRLGISENGAKRHVAGVLAKLNCPNRALAVAVAFREGLVDDA
jgi:DNA-binding NarL/FixJ family response regulator